MVGPRNTLLVLGGNYITRDSGLGMRICAATWAVLFPWCRARENNGMTGTPPPAHSRFPVQTADDEPPPPLMTHGLSRASLKTILPRRGESPDTAAAITARSVEAIGSANHILTYSQCKSGEASETFTVAAEPPAFKH